MDNHWYVGVDIGGTTIKMAIINTYGEMITKWEIPTNIEDKGKHITTDICKAIFTKMDELNEPKSKLAGIGVGAPGFINMDTGFIYKAVNIGWTDFPLKDRLEVETGLPVVVDNDANLAALGEMWRGAGDGAKNLLAVTLGTGVGGGLIANGNILHGVNGMAGEIGHITSIATGGAPCNCGKTGCLETIASATGIARIATEMVNENTDSELSAILIRKGKLTAKDVFDCAKNEDKIALQVIDEVCFHLGLAIANLANAINPEKIVIGGGVSKAGDILLRYLNKHFKLYALPRVAEGAEITIATLGNDAGVIGAVWLIKQKISK
jgi:glucokinase